MPQEHQDSPQWLKNIKESSWEIELLISGGAIFSLFQFSEFYIDLISSLRTTTHLAGAGPLLMLGMFGIKVLTLGFVIHLLLRAYWLAMVCLNYVFPQGVNQEKLKWSKPFNSEQNKPNEFQQNILYINKQCGVVISMSIISALAIFGISIVFTAIFAVSALLENTFYNAITEYTFTAVFILFLVYILDFLCFGVIRKIPYFTYLVFPFFKFFDVITLRKYYQYPLWLFTTNINRIRLLLFASVFITVAMSLSYLSIYRAQQWPNLFDQRAFRWQMADNDFVIEGWYMDSWTEDTKHFVGIDSKVQNSNYLELFVSYYKYFDEQITQSATADSLRFFENIIQVSIDDSIHSNLEWFPTKKLNESNIGVTCMIPLHNLENGSHYVSVRFPLKSTENHKGSTSDEVKILFWVNRRD